MAKEVTAYGGKTYGMYSKRALSNGSLANTHPHKADSYIVEDAAGIAFGLAAKRGTNAGECSVGIGKDSANVANDFLGFVMYNSGASEEKIDEHENATLLWEGDIALKVDGAVSAGDPVTVTIANGKPGAKAAGAAVGTIPNATWITSAATGELAIARIGSGSQR